MIQKFQKMQYYNNTANAAGVLIESQAEAMKSAAKNEGGAMLGFMGLNMAQQSGGANAQNLFAMANQQQGMAQQEATQTEQAMQSTPKTAGAWVCSCGHENTGKFCSECGKPAPAKEWTCSCGTVNTGKFCSECGSPRP